MVAPGACRHRAPARIAARPRHSLQRGAAWPSAALVESLLPAIGEGDADFALFGHSMGALIAFEIARAFRRTGRPEPAGLFVSGCAAPPLFSVEPKIHHLPDEQFIERLRRLSATPTEVLENREMMELVLPALRADFTLCETYEYEPSDDPLTCPIVAFAGASDEEVSTAGVEAWASETRGPFRSHTYPGGHFFLLHHWPEILAVVSMCLKENRRWRVRSRFRPS